VLAWWGQALAPVPEVRLKLVVSRYWRMHPTQLSELKKCSIFSANYKIKLRRNSIFWKRSKQLLIAKN
jgi:hypothetical protein